MATYSLPPEPKADTLWTVTRPEWPDDPVVTMRWTPTRDDSGTVRWWESDTGSRLAWHDLLNLGHVIHDQHPDLGDCSPTPWKWDDATGGMVEVDDVNAGVIVRAVNAYAERLAAEGEVR